MEDPPTATLHVSTQIVLLDAVVVDKKGRPVASAFNREDFVITEDGKPQRLVSFEPPSPRSTTATNVFVLDELNTGPADKAYYLVCLEQYFRSLPETLPVPAEFMVLTATSLRVVQPATRSRAELLSALIHLPASDATLVNLEPDRLSRSLGALELIAVESLGGSGKTAVVWLGPGYGIDLYNSRITMRAQTELFIRYLTNTLLQSRLTLHVLFPPDFVDDSASLGTAAGTREVSAANPFNGGINFRSLAAQTGGSVSLATNDLTGAMRDALDLGRGSYALGYRPENAVTDGRFRRIRVALRNSNLRVMARSGYYAPDSQEENAPQAIQVFQMAEAAKSTLPFHAIPIRITHIDRSPDATSVEFTIFAEGKDLPWRSEGQDASLSELTAGGVSLSKEGKKLSSHFRNVNLMARSQDAAVLGKTTASFKLSLAIPANTDHVRLVVSSQRNGQLGCVDASRAAIDAAPVTERTLVSNP